MADNKEPVTRQDIIDEISKLRESSDRWRVQIEARVNDTRDILKNHHKSLYGNGEPGLDEVIRKIQDSQNTLIKLAWIVVSTVVAIGVSGAIAAMVYLIKVMPTP